VGHILCILAVRVIALLSCFIDLIVIVIIRIEEQLVEATSWPYCERHRPYCNHRQLRYEHQQPHCDRRQKFNVRSNMLTTYFIGLRPDSQIPHCSRPNAQKPCTHTHYLISHTHSQADFEQGTFRIRYPGIYILGEVNVELCPLPVQKHSYDMSIFNQDISFDPVSLYPSRNE
jgi:hypothetical protein